MVDGIMVMTPLLVGIALGTCLIGAGIGLVICVMLDRIFKRRDNLDV